VVFLAENRFRSSGMSRALRVDVSFNPRGTMNIDLRSSGSSALRWTVITLAGLAFALLRPVAPVAHADEPFLDLVPAGLRVYEPYDGYWFSGGHFELQGEALSKWDLVPQLFDRETGSWTDASGYFNQFRWDSVPNRTDPNGIDWFDWYGTADWPNFSANWAGPVVYGDDGQRATPIELRFTNRSDGRAGSHFDRGGQQCIRENEGRGVVEARAACALEKDSITYFFECGRSGQACCAGDAQLCDDDADCVDGTCRARPKPPSNPPPSNPPSNPPPSSSVPYPGNWWHVECQCVYGEHGAWGFTLDYCFDIGQAPSTDAPCIYPKIDTGATACWATPPPTLVGNEVCNATSDRGALRNYNAARPN
jgi:hypothetical protein